MIKAVVDVEQQLIAIDAEKHADLQSLLVEHGPEPDNLWGIKLFPAEFDTDDFVKFESMINVRPDLGNDSIVVEDPAVQAKIMAIVDKIVRP